MTIAIIRSKGQITIPAKVRLSLHLGAGDRVEFVEVAPERFEFVAVNLSVAELKGMFGKAKRTVSIEKMRQVIAAKGASAR